VRSFAPRLSRALAGPLDAGVGGLAGFALGGRRGGPPPAAPARAFAITFGPAGAGIAIRRLGRAGAGARDGDALRAAIRRERRRDDDRRAEAGA
jgi:hypothetical protein